ncbi:MAG: imelysin family protein [Bacteroidota bacterium]
MFTTSTPGKLLLLLSAVFALMLAGCTDDDDNNTNGEDDFDRAVMIAHYSSNIIVPEYEAYQQALDEMEAAREALMNEVSANTLVDFREAFKAAWLQYQRCKIFEFGPAQSVVFRDNNNSFPTDTNTIKANIDAGEWNLNLVSNLDAKGLPALDYLLFRGNEVVQTAFLDTSYANYVRDVVADLRTRAQTVVDSWTTGGYTETFNSLDGVDVGSATSMIVNELIFDWEANRRHKLGDPAGINPNTNLDPNPYLGEAPYSRFGKELCIANQEAIYRLFNGRTPEGTEGPGLDDYLNAIDAQHTDGPLAQTINDQFVESIAAAEAIPNTIFQSSTNNVQAIQSAYDAVQQNIVYLKTDMTSALGIQITFNSGDGD